MSPCYPSSCLVFWLHWLTVFHPPQCLANPLRFDTSPQCVRYHSILTAELLTRAHLYRSLNPSRLYCCPIAPPSNSYCSLRMLRPSIPTKFQWSMSHLGETQ